jgi:hypothetical protein
MFKAPQKSLKSSWKSEVFKKPKLRGILTIKRSLGTGKVFVERYQNEIVSKPYVAHSNLY